MIDRFTGTQDVQWCEIDAEIAGQRIDNFLLGRLKGVPRSHVYRILRRGEIRVNGGRVKAEYRLDCGDRVRIPPVRHSPASEGQKPRVAWPGLEHAVLFEDASILVLDKPAGMPVHGGSGVAGGVIEALRQARPHEHSLELVHRLDRDTSGCLLIAKKRSALRILHEAFREDRVEKRYVALLAGAWVRRRQLVDAPLHKNVLRSGERVVKVSPTGRPAQTDFSVIRRFPAATLVEARPITGRTHQIRVHAAYIGHPLVGDERYGLVEVNRKFKQLGSKRLFLHAQAVSFAHPESGAKLTFEAPLAVDLDQFLRSQALCATATN